MFLVHILYRVCVRESTLNNISNFFFQSWNQKGAYSYFGLWLLQKNVFGAYCVLCVGTWPRQNHDKTGRTNLLLQE